MLSWIASTEPKTHCGIEFDSEIEYRPLFEARFVGASFDSFVGVLDRHRRVCQFFYYRGRIDGRQ